MKNPVFAKLSLFIACVFFMGVGFMLMPSSQDARERVYAKSTAFLDTFHSSQKIEDKQKLPNAVLLSSEGRKVDLGELTKGRVTIINFWASWCAPCLEELPSLAKFQAANPEILIMPISLDMQKTLPELGKVFDNDNLRDLRWFYDEAGTLRKNLNLPIYPSTYVLDKQGNVVYILQGPSDWASGKASDFGRFLTTRY